MLYWSVNCLGYIYIYIYIYGYIRLPISCNLLVLFFWGGVENSKRRSFSKSKNKGHWRVHGILLPHIEVGLEPFIDGTWYCYQTRYCSMISSSLKLTARHWKWDAWPRWPLRFGWLACWGTEWSILWVKLSCFGVCFGGTTWDEARIPSIVQFWEILGCSYISCRDVYHTKNTEMYIYNSTWKSKRNLIRSVWEVEVCFLLDTPGLPRAVGPACRKPLPEPTARAEVGRVWLGWVGWLPWDGFPWIGWWDMGVSKNIGKPPNHPLKIRVFHYKPSILGYHYFWKHPYDGIITG